MRSMVVGAAAGAVQSRADNGIEVLVEAARQVGGSNPEHRDPALAQPGFASLVASGTVSKRVRDTLNLDREPRRGAIEVENVRADRMLAAEHRQRRIACAQMLP